MANKADFATPTKNVGGSPGDYTGTSADGGKPYDSQFEGPSGGIIPFKDLEVVKGVD